MRAIVVYESHWGNTAAIARAISEGIGPEAQALSTAEATDSAVADAELVVAGAPLLGFSLPTDGMVKGLGREASPTPPDLSHPSMRAWLESLPKGIRSRCLVRDANLVVARERGEGDPSATGGRGLPTRREGAEVPREG